MIRKLLAAAAVALALGGCVKVDKTAPKDLPAFVKIYPGAQQVVTVNVAGVNSVAFQAPAKPDDVVGFYRNATQSTGLTETPSQQSGQTEQRQAVFRDTSGQSFLVVVARPEGAGSMVSLTYKTAPKGPS